MTLTFTRYCDNRNDSVDLTVNAGSLTMAFVTDGAGSGPGFDIELTYKRGKAAFTLPGFAPF